MGSSFSLLWKTPVLIENLSLFHLKCISFLKDLNDDEPVETDSGDVGNNADSNIPQSKQKNAAMGLI